MARLWEAAFSEQKANITKESANNETIHEPAREVRVRHEVDVAVVGGGSAGCAAAVAAARNGASAVLLERFGHLGGMATGGLVIVIMPMSAGTAAALAIKQGVAVRSLDYRFLHDSLANQGVPLPPIGV